MIKYFAQPFSLHIESSSGDQKTSHYANIYNSSDNDNDSDSFMLATYLHTSAD